MTLKASIIKNISYLRFLFYHKVFLPCLVWNKRRKDKIRILFVLQYLAEWKTELLYLEMKKHPRIEPIIGIIPCLEMSGEENKLKEYCKDKGYDYLSLDPEKTLVSQVQPDFIIHQKPYVHLIYEKHLIINNISVPCIMLPYGIHTTLEAYGINSYLSLRSWRHFYENQSTLDAHKKVHRLRGINFRVTGLPFLDTLIQPSDQFPDPWQDKKGRKRIIYAPHHTVPPLFKKGYNFSTFIENGEFMLEMRRKYENQVYFVFKPHPLLYNKLVRIWGKEKTDAYYASWRNAPNSHIEEGQYLDLFKHSDAMIHDCGAFMVEYLFTGNPVMYLINEKYSNENLSPYVKRAFELHKKGRTHADIEQFIQNIIDGVDEKREERSKFYVEELLPPYGKTASQNIINAILGVEDYK